MKYDIEIYPAIKEHLLAFGYDKLKQTGEPGARKKTSNKWFETQDSISYWGDFFKQKIVFQEMVQSSSFLYDYGNYFCLDTGRIITGNNLKFLLSVMNSTLFFFAVKCYYGGGNLGNKGVRMKHSFFENFPLKKLTLIAQGPFIALVEKILAGKEQGLETSAWEQEIDLMVYDLYELTAEEIAIVEGAI